MDYQNVYRRARECFLPSGAGHFVEGQVHPRRVGALLAMRRRDRYPDRLLEFVAVYRGEPSAKHSPRGQGACQRQLAYWSSQGGVRPVTRPLHYYPRGHDSSGAEIWEPREKGIDVLIALDMLRGAIEDRYDVCVLFSGDSDLLPALEAVQDQGKIVEVVTWASQGRKQRLRPTNGCFCHFLDAGDYARLHDATDYTLPGPGTGAATG